MKASKTQRAIHLDAIARWFAKRRKTTIQKVLLDLTITPPSGDPEDVFYQIQGKRTYAFVVAGKGEVWQPCKVTRPNQTHELIGNVFVNYAEPGDSRNK